MVECDTQSGNINQAMEELKAKSTYMTVITRDGKDIETGRHWRCDGFEPESKHETRAQSDNLVYSDEIL